MDIPSPNNRYHTLDIESLEIDKSAKRKQSKTNLPSIRTSQDNNDLKKAFKTGDSFFSP